MGKVKSISPTKTARIVSLFNDSKMAKKEIARLLEVSPSTVRYTIKKYEDSRGSSASFQDAPRTGRPSKLTDQSVRRLVRLVEEDRRKPARIQRDELSVDGGPRVHVSTIKRALKNAGLHGRVAVKKPFVSKVNVAQLKLARPSSPWCISERSRRASTVLVFLNCVSDRTRRNF